MILGNTRVNMELSPKTMPCVSQTVFIKPPYQLSPEGLGALTSMAAARLGSDVVLCTRLGDDSFGNLLLHIFNYEGISTRAVKIDKNFATGLHISIQPQNGQRADLIHTGANAGLSYRDTEDAFLSYPDALITHMDCSEHTMKATIDYANRKSIPVFVEPSPSSGGFPLQGFPKLEVFTPDEDQTYGFTGIYPDSVDHALKAANKLYTSLDVKYVVLRLGRRGSFVYDGKYHEMVSPVELPLRDERGQASAYVAALTLYHVSTGNIIKAARFANIVSAVTGNTAGCADSLPTIDTIIQYTSKNGIVV